MQHHLADMDSATTLAVLQWQVELGADEPISEIPINRYELAAATPKPASPATQTPKVADPAPHADPVAIAKAAADGAQTLEDLAEVQAAFDLCELKKGARNFVFADGNPAARLMIIGEAPGREEDREGRPFVGRAGQLLDRMLTAIGLSRTSTDAETGVYITNVLPWRPPQNREPTPEEIAMMLPFLTRHVALATPDLIVLMGNTPCMAALGRRGILRLRGHWTQAFDRPALPMTHPAYLLRNPAAKREAWADLLEIQGKLKGSAG